MRTAIVGLCLIVSLISQDRGQQKATPQEEYQKKLADLNLAFAKDKADLAKWCADAGLIEEAKRELEEAGVAEDVAKAVQEKISAAKPKSDGSKLLEYQNKLETIQRKYSDKYLQLANWAKLKKLKQEFDTLMKDKVEMLQVDNDSMGRKILERLNQHRKNALCPPCTLNASLSDACRKHSNYLVINNGRKETEGQSAHSEDSKLPGYTTEGKRAAANSDIAWCRDPMESVDNLMASMYHRWPLIKPSLRSVGFGYTKGSKFGAVSVLDCQTIFSSSCSREAIIYPGDGQTGVGLEFVSENPDPIPEKSPRPPGYPVTCTFYMAKDVVGAKMVVKDPGGSELEGYFWCPEKPATTFSQGGCICFIPKSPLISGTTYMVSCEATVDGLQFSKSWKFTTK